MDPGYRVMRYVECSWLSHSEICQISSQKLACDTKGVTFRLSPTLIIVCNKHGHMWHFGDGQANSPER